MVVETETSAQAKVEAGAAVAGGSVVVVVDDEQPKATPSSLGRQSSIYSLTLDEFQNTFSDNRKNFGSMNMDEFLSNIWNAEENQAVNEEDDEGLMPVLEQNKATKPLQTQLSLQSLQRQGSLSLPAPLCRKTVEEVWSEIQKDQLEHQEQQEQQSFDYSHRQTTFGEMTLEDFLIKAGVVRESGGGGGGGGASSSHRAQQQGPPPPPPPPQQHPGPQQYGLYQSSNGVVNPNFGMGPVGPVMSIGYPDHQTAAANGMTAGGIPAYQPYPQSGGMVGESSINYAANGKRSGGFPQHTPVCFGGAGVTNGGGYGPGQPLRIGSPVSPVSSDGMCANMDNSGQHGMDAGKMRGKKRTIDGPTEKVVERRQRRMIKNRESAARSRARKQAYTVELEAELNVLKEDIARLRRVIVNTEAQLDQLRKKELFEDLKRKRPSIADMNKEKLKRMRRATSAPPP